MTGEVAMFANRLRKNARHWGKWARRRGITCYRVYDRDIPEFPLVLDLFEGRGHLQEFFGDWKRDDAEYRKWLESLRAAAADALEIPPADVVLKRRQRQRGLAQYQKTGTEGEDFIVGERGHRFIVNLEAYVDTGLFLDHRDTRRMVEERVRGKRFLNLYCYTGSFTVYAAAGGAASSVSVDLSNTYLGWARRNFELNGLDPARHQLIRADVGEFLAGALKQGGCYDLIVLDPPSFSNSKKMTGVLDVQRDHGGLIAKCMAVLGDGGELFFSTNLRHFKLDSGVTANWRVQDISQQTIPDDFRNRRVHQCWLLTRG